MLKKLIAKYGKQKVNSLTKYPSILTLHKLGEKGKLTDELTTDISGETMYATEKIDGTNVRIILGEFSGEYLIGSRENILHHSDDLYFDPAQGIVESMKSRDKAISSFVHQYKMMVIYGELFGGKISSNSKQYGTEETGFRVFDIAVFDDLSILDSDLETISRWRETQTDDGIKYGQNFLPIDRLNMYDDRFWLVPSIDFQFDDTSHESIYNALKKYLPQTNVPLTESAGMKPEGAVLRNADRSKIVKVRYEDYERTLR